MPVIVITQSVLKTLGVGFKALFEEGKKQAPTDHEALSMRVNSSTGEEEYGWLGDVPGVREWLGPRQVNNFVQQGYRIKNRKFEDTFGVKADVINDDNLGVYSPRFRMMGRATAAFPCQLVYELLKAGFTTPCYDGQSFFDTDHPVIRADGSAGTYANTDGGAGRPWFLTDSSQEIKPIILQVRQEFDWIEFTNPNDSHVFHNDEFLYGTKGRMNVGFGFPQFIWGSRQPLNATNYAAARAALIEMKGDHGRPMGVMPNLLVVDGTNEGAARKITGSELAANGETNEWKGTAAVLVTPWLTA